jgi:hypothetical protein
MDKELKEWMDSYSVSPADDALVDRIVAQAEQSRRLPFSVIWHQRPAARAAMLAAIAVIGFSGGMLTVERKQEMTMAQQSAITAATPGDDTVMYQMIINPQSLEEVML